MIRIKKYLMTAVLAATAMLSGPVLAEEFPSRPIKIIVGFDPGGSVDANMRTIAPFMEKILKVPVVIENRPGAGGAIAWTNVSKSKPDGYTLGNINYPAIAGITATGGIQFDPLEKFTYLGNFIYEPNVIAVKSDSPYKSLADMVAYLKAHPSGISYASNGVASLDGLVALAVNSAGGVKFRSVNFQGDADSLVAVLGGHVDAMGMAVSTAAPLIQSGQMRAVGVGGDGRNPVLPDVPTFAEQGYPLAVNAASRGLIMPAGADPAVIAKLRDAIKTAAMDPEYLATAKKMSQATHYVPPEQARGDIAKQIEFVKTVVPPKSQ